MMRKLYMRVCAHLHNMQNTEDRILDATIKLLDKVGWKGATTKRIAIAAGNKPFLQMYLRGNKSVMPHASIIEIPMEGK